MNNEVTMCPAFNPIPVPADKERTWFAQIKDMAPGQCLRVEDRLMAEIAEAARVAFAYTQQDYFVTEEISSK